MQIHNMSRTPEYKAWIDMKGRCFNKNNKSYNHYGGRGITVHKEWVGSFISFFNDLGHRPKGKYSLERIDNDKNYEPGNCEWSTWDKQSINRRVLRKRKDGQLGRGIYHINDRYYVKLQRDKKQHHVGVYDTLEEAHEARKAAESIYEKYISSDKKVKFIKLMKGVEL